MSRTLRILARAQSDVEHVFNWLVRRSVRGAIAWYLAFTDAVKKIAAWPESFAEAPEAGPLGRPLRQSLFKTRRGRWYRIVFELSDTEIFLLRIRGPGQARLRRRDLSEE
jgi:plasmid stabilization system protein ParE